MTIVHELVAQFDVSAGMVCAICCSKKIEPCGKSCRGRDDCVNEVFTRTFVRLTPYIFYAHSDKFFSDFMHSDLGI